PREQRGSVSAFQQWQIARDQDHTLHSRTVAVSDGGGTGLDGHGDRVLVVARQSAPRLCPGRQIGADVTDADRHRVLWLNGLIVVSEAYEVAYGLLRTRLNRPG